MARWIEVNRSLGAGHVRTGMVNLDNLDAVEKRGTKAIMVWNRTSPRCEWAIEETYDRIVEELQ